MQLQGKNVTPVRQLSLLNYTGDQHLGPYHQNQKVVVQKPIWRQLMQYLEEGNLAAAKRLAFSDDLHALQCLANKHWMDLMETAHYR